MPTYGDVLPEDQYDGRDDFDNDLRDYSRNGEPVAVVSRRFPEGEAAIIYYQVPDTNCYCLSVAGSDIAEQGVNLQWSQRTYALASEISA